MSTLIRQATDEDADELARLRWDFRIEHGTPVTRDFAEFVDEFRCLWTRFVEKVPHPSRRRDERPIVYVTNVYVEPGLRNAGIGRRLMDAALEHARELHAAEAIVWPTDRSVAFYERAGFGTDRGPLWLDLAGD